MHNNSKDQMTRDMICKSHSARTERELYRICPSKLNKRELEDLYFALLENNLDLKRTVNSQREKIKELSTKVQRMSASQRSTFSKEQRECCLTIKAAYNDQKESIADLKRTNERMAERIRLLNMRLCSARQFLKRSPGQASPLCMKCCMGPTISTPKNTSITTLNIKTSDTNLKSKDVSTQTPDKSKETIFNVTIDDIADEVTPLKAESLLRNVPEKRVCEENKCRTTMEQLRQTIVKLDMELSRCHEEYGSRIGKLEGEVLSLRLDKNRVLLSGEQNVKVDQLTTRLSEADAHNRELATLLAIERGKVLEMETRVKAAQMSTRVKDTIEEHLAKANTPDSKRLSYEGLKSVATREGHSKNLDDSGFADGSKSNHRDEEKIIGSTSNQELMKKIENLQAQFDHLKVYNATSSITPVNKPFGDVTNDANIIYCDKPLITDNTEGPVQLKEVAKGSTTLTTETSQHSYPGYHFYGIHINGEDASVPKKCLETHVPPQPDPVVSHKHTAEIDCRNDSLPTMLQQLSLQKHCVEAQLPHKFWDNTWDRYPAVLPTTSKGFIEDANNVTGMYSPSEQNERDAISVIFKDTTENKNDELNKHPIPRHFPVKEQQTFATEHKKSSFRQQPCNKNTHIEIQTIDERHNDPALVNPETKYGKGTKLIFEEGQMNIVREKLNLLVPSTDSFSVNDYNIVSMDSIEMKKRRITNNTTAQKPETHLKVFKNGNDIIASNSTADEKCCLPEYVGNTGIGNVTQQESEGGPKSITSSPRPLLAERQPVESKEIKVAENEMPMKEDGHEKIDLVPHENVKTTGNIEENDKRRCVKATNEFGVQVTPRPEQKYAPYRRSTVCPDTHTYTLQHNAEDKSRDNDRDTDCEISELTDLPTELDDKNPRQYLSPGEDKVISTMSSSRTGPTSDLGSLSEGELPGLAIPRKLSEGEKPMSDIDQYGQKQTSAQKMETALRAVAEELAKCKQLLLHQRKREGTRKVMDVEVMTDTCPAPIALKLTPGNQRIAETVTAKCIFTLHIGTVVLSDKAVINSMDMSLVLMWKFYDQSLTMTRMRSGRVVLFDFSTEYDVRITDEFLKYMKHEEMPIVICQIDKYEEPFASCSLPLREALLHTNRRADMSLSLCSGPRIRHDLDGNVRAGGDEVGVLDLWCMLRTESRLLTVINRAIVSSLPTQPVKTYTGRNDYPVLNGSRAMEQVFDEEPSNEYHLSQEFDLNMGERYWQDSNVGTMNNDHNIIMFDELKSHKKGGRWKLSDLSLMAAKQFDADKKSVTIQQVGLDNEQDEPQKDVANEDDELKNQSLDITILWLALNEESEVMTNPNIQRLYVAYSFLGRKGADLETPISLPKPKNQAEKCHFNFKKTFQLHDCDLPLLGHMARCRGALTRNHYPGDCIIFTVVSEPPEDPLGLAHCQDIGQAYVYLGDILSCSANSSSYMEVVPVWSICGGKAGRGVVLGVLALKLDGLQIVRRCLHRSHSHHDLTNLY